MLGYLQVYSKVIQLYIYPFFFRFFSYVVSTEYLVEFPVLLRCNLHVVRYTSFRWSCKCNRALSSRRSLDSFTSHYVFEIYLCCLHAQSFLFIAEQYFPVPIHWLMDIWVESRFGNQGKANRNIYIPDIVQTFILLGQMPSYGIVWLYVTIYACLTV